jgi:hypothetical protein
VSVIDFQTKRIVIEVEFVRTWGAAVLRPYMILPERENSMASRSL